MRMRASRSLFSQIEQHLKEMHGPTSLRLLWSLYAWQHCVPYLFTNTLSRWRICVRVGLLRNGKDVYLRKTEIRRWGGGGGGGGVVGGATAAAVVLTAKVVAGLVPLAFLRHLVAGVTET